MRAEGRGIVLQTCHKRQDALFLFGAILLLAVTQTALARDPALPPGSDFQTAIQGAHHLEKRGVARWLMNGIKLIYDGKIYFSFNGRFYSSHADRRMYPNYKARGMYTMADNIIKHGKPYLDKETKRMVKVNENGGVVLGRADESPNGVVITIITPRHAKKCIKSGRYTPYLFR
ncbi:MAG: general secretion pathway protein GspB, partial [Candidatus Thiodiazotropha taylori]|nr:general secretion pathway protein GspB [Candidatus Thiodiazotropha taylori]MCW4248993.1 general secretion pathway protein GspB [Candidatus Thiodiazotropha endolucinida]MCG8075822.1 general secretion pathway protein GspB [Candidatus Thiodiazotropha taylori]MCG8117539.1 general secretion pathway protein GspB [Candidatus Thiodiazotropha taylori]MCW4301833.1 general secretion pathway protein GspB [Candidatus Thiodiazotropha endolucinida]